MRFARIAVSSPRAVPTFTPCFVAICTLVLMLPLTALPDPPCAGFKPRARVQQCAQCGKTEAITNEE